MNVVAMAHHEMAADWLARLESPECTPAERAAFEDWLAESVQHVDAFLEAERLHAMAASLRADPALRAALPGAPVSALRPPRRGRPASRRWPMALAASLVMAIGVLGWMRLQPGPVATAEYATAVGEMRQVVLEDGTRMTLDTGTVVATAFDRDAREVELVQGRVRFEVGEDPERPFRVRAAASTIRDIGTTFQVTRRGDDVDVGLVEGIVDVGRKDGAASVRLAPGERVRVDAQGRFSSVEALDLPMAEGWPRGELVFRDRRLEDLVLEMNRYSAKPLRLGDPSLAGLSVSGVFRANAQGELVAALQEGWGLGVEEEGDAIVLRAAPR
ncbi:FecR family protein [Marilutibacter aestuarii]|uniref:DUF4880 domain-containing protein n=1 Tax=Marilutibacter aestuarii TaxID=1706195 RepID=A0A508ARK8_9GAMM|nr:FecR domain-containing protein [Lysobacter aestuarii]TQD51104.1 DUF4880 domain-containing protein [Lysobacter aestuarii]